VKSIYSSDSMEGLVVYWKAGTEETYFKK